MKYCVIGKGKTANEMADKAITNMLQEYSRHLFDFTRNEFDQIVEYDILNIMAFYYSKMNAQQKSVLLDAIENELCLFSAEDTVGNLAMFADDELYIPLSCKLIDRLGDRRITVIVYESILRSCMKMTTDYWKQENSFSNYLVLLNAAYFCALSYKVHVRESYKTAMKEFCGQDSYDEFVELLYEKHADNLGWDSDVDLDYLDDLISESRRYSSFEAGSQEEFMDAVEAMSDIRRNHTNAVRHEDDKEGFELIVQKTGIRELKCEDIQGFECHFCEAKSSDEEYIIVYQKNARISEIIDSEEEWSRFQRELYKEDIRQNNSSSMVYIVYILDAVSDNIPIQIIESNKTYGRKYVFTEEETITFINGIVRTSHDEIGAVSPVQEWDRILREEHLTACMTEAYSAKKVEGYLSGARFDADYVHDDDYVSMKQAKVPQIKWVKSLDTTGFRDFCFDDKVMTFGQINLFYGANGSGKTSVLEAIEYALTAEVRRVKDFKVKLPTDNYPKLSVYDTEAGIHTFTPGFSKKNNKEIERVWYGIPAGRNKSNLNDNFNRFNAFDSEAAYKFIHESDNSEDSFATMFGNLMFGETVVDHEKKWQRFKKAFNERYTELRSELSDARNMAAYYEESLAHKSDSSKSQEIEQGIVEMKLRSRARLPKASSDRYPRILEEMRIVRKYVDVISAHHLDSKTFSVIEEEVAQTKRNKLLYTKQRREKTEEIARLADDNRVTKQKIFDVRESQGEIQQRLDRVNTDIRNWSIVQNVLGSEATLRLVDSLLEELTKIDRELYYISRIEQRTAVVNFLKLDSYESLSNKDRHRYESEYDELKQQRLQLENQYNEAKKAFGEREQQTIELRKIGKTLLIGSICPLCGHEYDSTKQLLDIIDNAAIVDDSMEALITNIQKATKRIMDIEQILDRQRMIDRALIELEEIKETVPMVSSCGSNYRKLYDYFTSKAGKEKRKAEIIEQQAALDSQGFSISNINACRTYKTTDSTYLEYKRSGTGTYDAFLQGRLLKVQLELGSTQTTIEKYEKQLQQNAQKEEILRTEIHQLESMLEVLDADTYRDIEQALENIKTKFELPNQGILEAWVSKYHALYDKCELEIERIEPQNMIAFEKEFLAEYKATIKRDEPMVERCARAVQAFERMPSLRSFVEKGIRSNIQQISKFFKWMHHSGEFEKLDIDEEGIYAVRGLTNQEVRTYEMSTGQRATIAMAVMFALHMAAPDAPQFLLLDEPLATMDDTQVLNVLDILKSMAEQKTQIFFTTANGIMINLFKECFKDTPFDYKEYEFIKRVNRPSEIKESSINNTKSIEELTLDDLTLDFHQFAQIRSILRRNQEKLVAKEDWEELPEDKVTNGDNASNNVEEYTPEVPEGFYPLLTQEEQKVLDILVVNQPEDLATFVELFSLYPTYKILLEQINEKALVYYSETIINTDDTLCYIEEDYIDELQQQHTVYYVNTDANSWVEEQRQLKEGLRKAKEQQRQEEERRIQLEEEFRKSEEKYKLQLDEERQKAENARLESEELFKIQLETLRQEGEKKRQLEEERRKAEENLRLKLEEKLREEEMRKAEAQQKMCYREQNLCQHCGGTFTGLINKKCKVCGKIKDYS